MPNHLATIAGARASKLGLAAYDGQDPCCVEKAFELGINYFFFYSAGEKRFTAALKSIAAADREQLIIATGSGARTTSGLQSARRTVCRALGTDILDIFFAEYINPDDDLNSIFGKGGVLDELQRWKQAGHLRYVGATAHDRKLAQRLAEDSRVDVLMHRFNMAHRKAASEVFPAAIKCETPVVAFTATRWGSLLEPLDGRDGELPTAADCYRFCLAEPAVHVVLTAPVSLNELEENVEVLRRPKMNAAERRRWEKFGDAVYRAAGQNHQFESRWP